MLQPVTPVSSAHDGTWAVPSPFMVEGAPVTLLPQSTTRHVLAGMAHTLAGVASPVERFCPLKVRARQEVVHESRHVELQQRELGPRNRHYAPKSPAGGSTAHSVLTSHNTRRGGAWSRSCGPPARIRSARWA